MSFTVSCSNQSGIIAQKQEGWDSDFEKNHKEFGAVLARSIAEKAIEKLKKAVDDPYREPISEKHPVILKVNFDITKMNWRNKPNAAAKMTNLIIQDCNEQISSISSISQRFSPFKEWLEYFSALPKEKSQRHLREHWIQDRMAVVGHLVKETLAPLLEQRKSDSLDKYLQAFSQRNEVILSDQNLRFKVEWHRHSENSNSCSAPSGRNNHLIVKMWLDRLPQIYNVPKVAPSVASYLDIRTCKKPTRFPLEVLPLIIVATVVFWIFFSHKATDFK